MNTPQMKTCQICGGAQFFGTGTTGWGGPLCNCNYRAAEPQRVNPWPQIAIDHSEKRIMAKLDEIMRRLDALERK